MQSFAHDTTRWFLLSLEYADQTILDTPEKSIIRMWKVSRINIQFE